MHTAHPIYLGRSGYGIDVYCIMTGYLLLLVNSQQLLDLGQHTLQGASDIGNFLVLLCD